MENYAESSVRRQCILENYLFLQKPLCRYLATGQFRTGDPGTQTNSQELLEVLVLPGSDQFPSAGLPVPVVQSGTTTPSSSSSPSSLSSRVITMICFVFCALNRTWAKAFSSCTPAELFASSDLPSCSVWFDYSDCPDWSAT